MFERFSRGYYLGRLYVQPRETGAPVMCREQHERLHEQFYRDDIDAPDTSLIMKVDSTHFSVQPEEGLPRDTLTVPRDLLDSDDLGELRNVLLAKGDRARQLSQFAVTDWDDGGNARSDPFRPSGFDEFGGPGPS